VDGTSSESGLRLDCVRRQRAATPPRERQNTKGNSRTAPNPSGSSYLLVIFREKSGHALL